MAEGTEFIFRLGSIALLFARTPPTVVPVCEPCAQLKLYFQKQPRASVKTAWPFGNNTGRDGRWRPRILSLCLVRWPLKVQSPS